MKNFASIILILLIVVVMGLYFVSFQVRETETVLVTTFRKPSRELSEPGWYFKWPTPIQQVHRFDSRMRTLDGIEQETPTEGAVPIIVKTYVVWRIVEPLEFFNSVQTVREAERKLLDRIGDTQNRVIGLHRFSEFINSDPAMVKFAAIEEEMLTSLRTPARTDYGIEIVTLGIRQLKVNEDVTQKVFDRMRAERTQRTLVTIAQGKAEATRILEDARRKRRELLAGADSRAKAIRGRGDAEAAKHYELLEADPELAMFLRETEALQKIFENKTTIILGGESVPVELLKKMPTLQSKNP